MRIQVIGDDSISRQARSYAEYRLFAALPLVIDTSRIRSSLLVLARVKHDGACDRVSCAVTIELDSGEVLRLKMTGDHPYAAINRTIDRLRDGWRHRDPDVFQAEHMVSD